MTPHAGLVLGGRYELESRIAVGGMGEVWVARDQHLHRRVAAKVLRAEFAGDSAFLDRLRAEARNSAALSHLNIAAMHDYGEQEGSGYLIMELVVGEPLADLLERERTLDPVQLLPILAQTARALHTAHMGGVVHRDVKPSNILLTPDGYVKITDFGISLGSNQAPMTAAGMVMGTAQYLPPEQAMGRAATGAGDIYALGIIAYEALAGHRPFTGSTQVEIAFAHVNTSVPPLPDAVDPRVRAVVMHMLEKDPERRPRSAASLARALEALAAELAAPAGSTAQPAATEGVADGATSVIPDGATSVVPDGAAPVSEVPAVGVVETDETPVQAELAPVADATPDGAVRWHRVGSVRPSAPATPPATLRHDAAAGGGRAGRAAGAHRDGNLVHMRHRGWRRHGWILAAGLVIAVALLTLAMLWLSRLGDTAAGVAGVAPILSASLRRPAGVPRAKDR